ncbi:hypothetical protein K3001_19295, partial [Pseudomonas aeruginosa]|nr:hypothetical protein [Pseudomonas aeruginosa]
MRIEPRPLPETLPDLGDLPPLLARLYAARGVRCAEELDKGLARLIPYQRLKGIEEGVALLVDALEGGQRILIVGDFDADGATASSVGVLALRMLGAAWVDYLVPNRFEYGYGLTPGLEYVSKTLVPLQPGNDAQRFAELSSQVRATDVSSHSFNEDAFAGIMQAVDEMDWSPYAGRVVLLVTDAGALRKNDPLGRTQMNEAEVRQAALRKGVKIYALHLRTPAGKNNHGYAEQQYRSLTADANPKIADLYIPVAGGEVNAFGNTVKEIGTVFADLVHDAGNRKPQAPRFDAAPSVASKSAAIGYAMQMEFLGRRDPVRAPQVVTAWTADRDLTNPALPAFQVCVLLSKLQLNELQQSLKLIVDAAKRTQTSPKDFFQEIASASAYMSRDPAQLVKGSNLAQSGVLGEYLEGLPYRSKSLNMTQDLWLSLSVAEQQDFIDELESKIRLYETFHNDVANWVRFGDADAGDALYRVPLSTL